MAAKFISAGILHFFHVRHTKRTAKALNELRNFDHNMILLEEGLDFISSLYFQF